MDVDQKLIIAGGAITIIAIGSLFYAVHGDDSRLKAECKANGGVFVEAREPPHVCVKPAGE